MCFFSSMTSSEWAAWVQAIGSIVAIFGAAGIAIWQANKQHANSQQLLRLEHQLVRTEVARALLSLSKMSLLLLKRYAKQLPDRTTVHAVAGGQVPLDLNELRVVEGAVQEIPLHSLPHQLVSLTMMVNSTLRQFREHVEHVMKVHRQMAEDEFVDFFNNLSAMQKSLQITCDDIQAEIDKSEN
jgi:hypothetical protein